VQIRLFVELRDESIRIVAQRLELTVGQRVRHGAA
jgi:hypothetical protein